VRDEDQPGLVGKASGIGRGGRWRGGRAWTFITARFHVAVQHQVQRRDRLRDALLDQRAVLDRGALQHVVDDLGLDARVADAQAQAPEIGACELRLNVAQSVVPGVAATELHLDLAGQQIEFVVGDQHVAGRDLEETRQGGHDLPDRFMNVIGLSSQTGPSRRDTLATSP